LLSDIITMMVFGDINPSGKLPFVVPHKESDLPQVNWDTTSQFYQYYHGYTKLEKEGIEPLLPYGYGLSYTTFEISDSEFETDGKKVTASCKVLNKGKRAGSEVVQLYVGFKNSKVDRPIKILRGFQRISLEAGEIKEALISCPVDKLCWYNPDTDKMELEHMEYEIYIGTSSDNNDLMASTILL